MVLRQCTTVVALILVTAERRHRPNGTQGRMSPRHWLLVGLTTALVLLVTASAQVRSARGATPDAQASARQVANAVTCIYRNSKKLACLERINVAPNIWMWDTACGNVTRQKNGWYYASEGRTGLYVARPVSSGYIAILPWGRGLSHKVGFIRRRSPLRWDIYRSQTRIASAVGMDGVGAGFTFFAFGRCL